MSRTASDTITATSNIVRAVQDERQSLNSTRLNKRSAWVPPISELADDARSFIRSSTVIMAERGEVY